MHQETETQVKKTYNDHLAISRSFKRKPFKIRKNFKDFKEKDGRYRYYARLSKWFDKHPEINIQLYFEATLFFHKDEEMVPIKEYCKSKALTNYTQYIKIVKSLDLDNKKSLQVCVDSFNFIQEFCEENNIAVRDYLSYKDEVKYNYAFLKHVKSLQASIYALFAYKELIFFLKDLYRDVELWNFYLEDHSPTLLSNRYEESKVFKTLAIQAKEKIQNKT